uniref:DNA repair protein RAD51 homolog 4-like n=1 Tax=Sinocyclocheilus anshuiensis TaxID=1608454 RepID=A0A671QNR9_9TELE
MVILREGICPGINEEFIKALQSEDIKTVEDFVSCNPEELARKCSLSYKMEALQKIKVFRVFDVFSLLACLQHLRSNSLQKASVGGGSVKALMVDSVSAVLSSMLGGKQNEGMSLLMQVAGELKMIAKDFNIAVLVTNHVTKDGNGHLKAGLGQSWSHVPRTRVLLQRVEDAETSSLRTATLTKSSRQVVFGEIILIFKNNPIKSLL